MIQLLQRQINTIPYTNAILRNFVKDETQLLYISLRDKMVNKEEFKKLDILKNLSLDLARQVNSEFIYDIGVLILPSGQSVNLEDAENRLILCLENASFFEYKESRFKPEPGDLLWLNEKVTISNTETSLSVLFILDFKEFLL